MRAVRTAGVIDGLTSKLIRVVDQRAGGVDLPIITGSSANGDTPRGVEPLSMSGPDSVKPIDSDEDGDDVSKWWKCDFQVATPGEPRFRGQNDWNLTTDEGRAAAADEYMRAARDAGLEVLGLADHNSTAWVDEMKRAGAQHGIVVFPGFEVGTGSGSDGVHLIVLGDPAKSARDLELLLSTACGFDDDNPRFQPHDASAPATAPRTIAQILDALPPGYLAIAPHAFSENGIASVTKGDIRWKALHHDRLGAIDVGNVDFDLDESNPTATYKKRFIRRELQEIPCLAELPFVSTSDAYSISSLGDRFTWIRMGSPSIEALRQAFLDHEARVLCDWHPRIASQSSDPNTVDHAWVQRLQVTGHTTADDSLDIQFHPRLNVVIGGRGSGKSTVVAALRNLYGEIGSLPAPLRDEAQGFNDAVLGNAELLGTHVLAYSGERQTAQWTVQEGSRTTHENGGRLESNFPMRVIGQKELFERSVGSQGSSTNLRSLVDDALTASGSSTPSRHREAISDAVSNWVSAVRAARSEQLSCDEVEGIRAKVAELKNQVAAFDDAANIERRRKNDLYLAERREMEAKESDVRAAGVEVRSLADRILLTEPAALAVPRSPNFPHEFVRNLDRIREVLAQALRDAAASVDSTLANEQAALDASLWGQAVRDSAADSDLYLQELSALGVDPKEYSALRAVLSSQSLALEELEQRVLALPDFFAASDMAWSSLENVHDERRVARRALLAQVQERSGSLRFAVRDREDTGMWIARVRELLGLRSDGFLDDFPSLAEWLWLGPAAEREGREQLWRAACVSGDFRDLATQAGLRTAFANRLGSADPLLLTRVAAEIPDDQIDVEFLRSRAADGAAQWVPLSSGSPGQRSSAMLSFVLHQGREPLVLDQPEDDLDTEWITQLVVAQLRESRWHRQVIVVTHNANIPVNADAELVIVMEASTRGIRVRSESSEGGGPLVPHAGAIEDPLVRADIQRIMEGGVEAFVRRERRYNNELNSYRTALRQVTERAGR